MQRTTYNTDITKEKLLELKNKGYNAKQAAKELKVSSATIAKRSKIWGISWKTKFFDDIVGQKFGKLTVLSVVPKKPGTYYCECICDCGNYKACYKGSLKAGTTKSCGCLLIEFPIRPGQNITGQKFGELTVIEWTKERGRKGGSRWKCQCSCGQFIEASKDRLKRGLTTACRKCVAARPKKQWVGYGNISGYYMSIMRSGAIRRGLEFNITIEYLWKLFLEQKGKCAISGVDIYIEKEQKFKIRQTASLDRIDNSKGYIEGNLQWIHKELQGMKSDKSDEKFINWCHIISDYQKSIGK